MALLLGISFKLVPPHVKSSLGSSDLELLAGYTFKQIHSHSRVNLATYSPKSKTEHLKFKVSTKYVIYSEHLIDHAMNTHAILYSLAIASNLIQFQN